LPEYVRLWNTENTVIKVNIERQRETLVIERTRGKKQKKKRVVLKLNNSNELILAVREAVKQKPEEQLINRQLIAMVDGGLGLLTVEWSPYWFGRCNALMIRGPVAGQCIALEEDAAFTFSIWLTALFLELITTGRLPLSDQNFPEEADSY